MHDNSPHAPNGLAINTAVYSQPPYELQPRLAQSPHESQILPSHPRSADPNVPTNAFRSPQSFRSPTSTNAYGPLSGPQRSNSDGQYYVDSKTSGRESPTAVRHPASASYDSTRYYGFSSSPNAVRPQKSSDHASRAAQPSSISSESPTQYRIAPALSQPPNQSDSGIGNNYPGYVHQQNFPPLTALPPPSISNMSQAGPFQPQQYYDSAGELINSRGMSADEMTGVLASESPLTEGGFSMFESNGYARSPVLIPEDFTAWIFGGQPMNHNSGFRRHESTLLDPSLHLSLDSTVPIVPPQNSMAVTSLLDSTTATIILSEGKREQILELIESRFNESNHSPVVKSKASLLAGDRSVESHVLSLRSLQTYIGSYWYHFHKQMPILHQPTFTANKAQNLLLVAVIAIGAANLDKIHGEEFTNAGAELANFLAWHLRGELFMDQDFRPPAKLWVLQTLLLLECYEKLCSSRVLHERSQIHHATTISLLRRGSSLLGRSALDSPPNDEDWKASVADTPDTWWNNWITKEATKRVAFAAFIIDSTHATMFSHTAVMLAHEMRLQLPCDESLWSATSGVEVDRLENSLKAEGVKPISFLDGLKWTLSGKNVRTNTFGRTALMAGLLNVSFHLSQRDIQVRSVGNIGGREAWRGSLTKAFDIWEHDWDTFSSQKEGSDSHQTTLRPSMGNKAQEHVFESRVVLHHLAHMGMHVDIVQCQIFAKAKRLLGRTITPQDYTMAANRMRKNWAPRPSARDAVFYSLKFLSQVLTPDLSPGVQIPPPLPPGSDEYNPRDDYLLNRPWVLYFAALVVWSYGYALDGPLSKMPSLETKEDQIKDMRIYMRRVAGVDTPNDLENIRDRNTCAGLLKFLAGQFKKCRWELMHEATTLLENCVGMLKGSE